MRNCETQTTQKEYKKEEKLMSRRRNRLLSNPFNDDQDLSKLFENLNLERGEITATQNMEATVARLVTQFNELATTSAEQISQLTATNTELSQKLTRLETAQATLQRSNNNNVTVIEYTDVVPTYATGADIQLDAFKVIHEFNGDRKTYRSWRIQVSKLMEQISGFKTHPKYAAALSIIRAKITGAASDILINNNTAHDINAMIDRLDFSYADQRPLYVIEAEMTIIKQNTKSLQEYYDAINQALNMVLTKISMTYKEVAEQKSLIAETQSKAIRTFITGLNSPLIRTTLYGNMPKSLSQAFAVAQTIQYDNQHLQLEFRAPDQQKFMRNATETRPTSNPNFRYQSQPPNQLQKPSVTTNPQQQKPTPMEIDGSGQYVQKTQFQPNKFQHTKRHRDPSFQYVNKSPSFQHANKQQRVNQVDEPEDIQSVYDDSLENNYDAETRDDKSTTSEQGSVFLEE